MKKSLIFFIFIFTTFYIFFLVFGTQQKKMYSNYLFKTKNHLNFHRDFSERLHHLRDSGGRWYQKNNPFNYLFSTINQFSSYKINILLQGDSWIESMSENINSLNELNKFGDQKKIGIINAGITSYSPSLMKAQYQLLEKDFKIKPDVILLYLDQSDIGDELCRYRNKKSENSTYVLREKYSSAIYDYTKIYKYSELELENYSFIKKNILLTNFEIYYFVNKNLKISKEIFTRGWKNRSEFKCYYKDIQKYLIHINENDLKYFSSVLLDYLDFLSKKKYLKKIMIVTFPHIQHLSGYYNVNVSDIVEGIKNEEDKIAHLNFSKLMKSNIKKIPTLDLYIENDASSHLTKSAHTNFFTKNILYNLNILINEL